MALLLLRRTLASSISIIRPPARSTTIATSAPVSSSATRAAAARTPAATIPSTFQQQPRRSLLTKRAAASPPPTPTNPPYPRSRYHGVSYHPSAGAGGKAGWIAEVRLGNQRIFYKSFPLDQEKEAALAVDDAIRRLFGPEFLTNFDPRSGAFLDPKHALSPASSSNGAAVGRRGAVSLVPELGRYKAVARLKGRAVLVGIWASEAEAHHALERWWVQQGLGDGSGGRAEAAQQSRFLGVSWFAPRRKWRARLRHEGEFVLDRYFGEEEEEEAAKAYDAAVRQHLGPGAHTNFDAEGRFVNLKQLLVRKPTAGGAGGVGAGVDYRGVSFSREKEMWEAKITVGGKTRHLGFFDGGAEEAARAYDAAARKWHGSRARTNFDEQGNRTESRLQFRNSPTARAQYVLATAAENEQAK